jgi:hypothetical protein
MAAHYEGCLSFYKENVPVTEVRLSTLVFCYWYVKYRRFKLSSFYVYYEAQFIMYALFCNNSVN